MLYAEPRGRLDERTLVLNRSWLAITTTTVRRALTMVYGEAAQVICPETYEVHDFESWVDRGVRNGDACVRTTRMRIPVPEIIVLSRYDHVPRRRVAFSRRNLYRRDNYTCHYCGRHPTHGRLTIDHVVPRSQGGRTSWENCVLACEECNKRKSDRSAMEAGMALLTHPRAPSWSWDVELSRGARLPSWERFLPRPPSRP